MTSNQKIFSILKRIKHKSEISPSPGWVEFRFNTSMIGSGILPEGEEINILMKLEQEKVIELHLPDDMDSKFQYNNNLTPYEFIRKYHLIWIKILPPFQRRYFWNEVTSLTENTWNLINPFWLLWQILRGVYSLIYWLWNRNRAITAIIGLIGTLLVYDWSLAWTNLKRFFALIGIM